MLYLVPGTTDILANTLTHPSQSLAHTCLQEYGISLHLVRHQNCHRSFHQIHHQVLCHFHPIGHLHAHVLYLGQLDLLVLLVFPEMQSNITDIPKTILTMQWKKICGFYSFTPTGMNLAKPLRHTCALCMISCNMFTALFIASGFPITIHTRSPFMAVPSSVAN